MPNKPTSLPANPPPLKAKDSPMAAALLGAVLERSGRLELDDEMVQQGQELQRIALEAARNTPPGQQPALPAGPMSNSTLEPRDPDDLLDAARPDDSKRSLRPIRQVNRDAAPLNSLTPIPSGTPYPRLEPKDLYVADPTAPDFVGSYDPGPEYKLTPPPPKATTSSRASALRKVAWPAFWVLWVLIPWSSGWFFIDRIECRTCFRDVLVHSLAVFGYVVLSGFVFSLSRPTRECQTEAQRASHPYGYMLGTREDTLLAFVLLGAFFAVMGFLMAFKF